MNEFAEIQIYFDMKNSNNSVIKLKDRLGNLLHASCILKQIYFHLYIQVKLQSHFTLRVKPLKITFKETF